MKLSEADRICLAQREESMWREDTRSEVWYMEDSPAADFIDFVRSGRTFTLPQTRELSRHDISATLAVPNLRLGQLDQSTAEVPYDGAVCCMDAMAFAHRGCLWFRTQDGWPLRFQQAAPYSRARTEGQREIQ